VVGRLDAYWADHLARALDDAVRGGAHRIRANMAGVSFMSSVGIRVLLKFYKQLQRIKGSLTIAEPSEPVRTVLQLAGLDQLFAPAPAAALAPSMQRSSRRLERETAAFEVFDATPGASLTCRVVGQPEVLRGGRFTAAHCCTVKFPDSTLGVGLGAFGSGFADCQSRFGEFLAAAGTAAYMPTDGTNVADSLVSAGAFVPELTVLYAVVCEGAFTHLARFEARPAVGRVALSELVAAGLDIAAADMVGMVMVAESAGLMGAALRRSPACGAPGAAVFAYPEIREWLSFTPEHAYPRSVVLVAGVAARAEHGGLAALLRPLQRGQPAVAHFHAAAFSYRPIQKGYVELQRTVSALFEGETLQGVLHLLNDDRAISGAGQSEFVRGACWIGPVADVVAGSP
jgi:anti-anti-sigma factor